MTLTAGKAPSQFHQHFGELRDQLNRWNLVPDTPVDEFDALVHQILSHLYQQADHETIHQIIEAELIVSFGLSVPVNWVTEITLSIFEWWEFAK